MASLKKSVRGNILGANVLNWKLLCDISVFCLVLFGLLVFLGMGNLNSLLFVKHDHDDDAENDHDQKKRVC